MTNAFKLKGCNRVTSLFDISETRGQELFKSVWFHPPLF